MAHNEKLVLTTRLKRSMEVFKTVREEVLYRQDVLPEDKPFNDLDFANYIMYYGNPEEKHDSVISLGRQLYIKNGFVTSSKPL